ncbi:hypothetical protein BGW36DRAFT_74018 [Talaromyces proteolyticus]|uniref:Myb-like domain-containing protein n=1 Tax=Talaromyces proteolyticus TaxID=1131652 RepID=A0AAD4PRS8_9EURO|nr:uncharacterized protein BGW36DRAFT_74018 [Talaromyces proteolyticus]KAH8689639.1 hypothetical protein BGW36DRAFT_74018 [Talaromyces proteolyticus]
MFSFTSSTIKKSGKKFAPKAPARRVGAGSATASKPKAEIQNARQPEPERAESGLPGALDSESQVKTLDAPQLQPSKTSPISESSPAPLLPTPKSTPGSSVPTVKATNKRPVSRDKSKARDESTPIPIPIPTSRLRYSATPSLPTEATPSKTQDVSHLPPADVSQVDKAFQEKTSRETTLQEKKPDGRDGRIQSSVSMKRTESAQDVIPSDRSSAVSEVRETPHIEGSDKATGTSGRAQTPRVPRKRRKSSTATEATPAKKQRAKRKREPTPEESEHVEIAPTVVRMSELCKDLRTGKKSKREVELRNLEIAEAERKQKAKDESRNSVSTVKQQIENGDGTANSGEATTPQKSQTGPRMRIVNGEIVIDNASLQVDRRAEAARDAEDMEEVYESRLSRKINQATYGRRTKAESWDEELTDLFYRGLRMFGTDFMMISKMFPGRSRRQIKLKFNSEERRDPERIKATLLGPREAVDIQAYSEMTNTIYDDPQLIQQELDEDKKRIEEQHAREKLAQEELLRNPGGSSGDADVVQSIETPDSRTRPRPKKNAAKNITVGTEEILGTIDDFP